MKLTDITTTMFNYGNMNKKLFLKNTNLFEDKTVSEAVERCRFI